MSPRTDGAGRMRSLALVLVLGACAAPSPGPEARSFLGQSLWPPPVADRARLQGELDAAARDLAEHPEEEAAWIWKGRRLAYLGRYRDAIDTFSDGLERHPGSFRLLRHRGHRFLTVRRVPEAILDLERAAALLEGVPDEVEPDGAPNARGVPRSTNHSNVFYHLGLAHYVAGDFAAAADAYRRGMPFARVNDDMQTAMTWWLYVSLRRLGREAEAEELLATVNEHAVLYEDPSYHALLLLFRGELRPFEVLAAVEPGSVAFCTRAHGVACWHLLHGERDAAEELWQKVLESPQWAAFGCLAAEAELAGLGARRAAP